MAAKRATGKTKPVKKATPVKKAKPAAKAPVKHAVAKKAPPKPPARKAKVGAGPLDLSALPLEAVTHRVRSVCLACVLDVFTRHLGLAQKTAYGEIMHYTPPVAELNAETPVRPYFTPDGDKDACPYCGSAAKWHARVEVHRIESGKATDTARRELVKRLPEGQFAVVEEKATQQEAFYEWLERMGKELNLGDDGWLGEISRHYLSRKEPKTDWAALFAQARTLRRSRRLESGWEVDGGRLFLAPMLFDELLLVQYLVSRSHKAGGLTLEGRYTLPELFARLRNSGYLRWAEVKAGNPSDMLEELLGRLGGGEGALKFHFIIDRRDLLAKMKALRLVRPPRPKRLAL